MPNVCYRHITVLSSPRYMCTTATVHLLTLIMKVGSWLVLLDIGPGSRDIRYGASVVHRGGSFPGNGNNK